MAGTDERDSDLPLKFGNEQKVRRQMRKRGWTEADIRQALQTTPIPAKGQKGPALRYIHPIMGKSIVVDAETGEIFHVGKEQYRYG